MHKALLQKFVCEKVKITYVDHMTIAQLELVGLRKIYEITKAHPTDPVGFGKYCSKTYEQVLNEDSGYCEWIKKTAAENQEQSDPKLRRFSQWLEAVTDPGVFGGLWELLRSVQNC